MKGTGTSDKVRPYLWGLDLSNSQYGASGVGGMIGQINRKSPYIFAIFLSLSFGCVSKDPAGNLGNANVPVLTLSRLNPPLLPPEEAKPVKLSLKSFPAELSQEDVLCISKLVGRIPGLLGYEIYGITPSRNKDWDYDVWVRSIVIRVSRSPQWHVRKVEGVVY